MSEEARRAQETLKKYAVEQHLYDAETNNWNQQDLLHYLLFDLMSYCYETDGEINFHDALYLAEMNFEEELEER